MKSFDIFIYLMAFLVITGGFTYLFCATFCTIINMELAKTILPYFFNILTLLIGYYWGSSKSSNDKTKLIN